MRTFALILVLLTFACSGAVTPPATRALPVASAAHLRPDAPRLIVQITIDQLRADLPVRMRDRFPAGGLLRFLDQGVVYDNAHYAHAITETAVGHATLFTGALPKDHGIVGNEWYDLAARKPVYAVDDDAFALLGEGKGKSPRKLLVPTLGDALIAATNGRALVRAVSEKDRGAILPAGERGRAYWLDDHAGGFVSSRYYLETLPDWVSALTVERYRGRELMFKPKSDSTKDFTRALRHTPESDEFLLELVRTMLVQEPLGRDEVTDLLSVSFSATDYVGHAFGPESKQAEDNLLRLDRTLAQLLTLLEAQVGADRLLVVLSADHGIAESPRWFSERGEDAGRIDPKRLIPQLNAVLRKQLGIDQDLVLSFVNPSLWLDEGAIARQGLTLVAVEQALVEVARGMPGVMAAFARTDVLAGKVVASELERRVSASVHPTRSGHVYLVPKPHWLLATEIDDLVAMHGTPHEYDTHVPIYWLGTKRPAAHVARPVDPRDIVPTLSRMLGTDPPRGCSGAPLHEVLGD